MANTECHYIIHQNAVWYNGTLLTPVVERGRTWTGGDAMSKRLPATPAPGPLEAYVVPFDPLFAQRNQRAAFRQYLAGLLLPTERNKTLTALANTEPLVGAQLPRAQQLQWFL